jgi:O-antigen ligase
LAAVAGIPVAAGIVLSLSRGAWVGVALACAAMMAGWSDTSRRLLPWITGFVLVVVLLAGSGLLPIGWSERLTAVMANLGVFDASSVDVTPENFAVVERMAHWQAAWQMFLEHPLLGVGAGNYPAAYERYSLPGWSEPLGHAHNYYLNVAAESGVLGVVAIMLLIGSIYLALATGLKRSEPRSFQRAVLVGLSGSFVVFTVHNLFDNLLVHGMPLQIGLLMGLVVQNAGPADHLAKAVPRLNSN